MNNSIHMKNALFGMVVTLGMTFVVGVLFALLIPAAKQAVEPVPLIASLLPMPTLLSLQFVLCYIVSRRSERMIALSRSRSTPGDPSP